MRSRGRRGGARRGQQYVVYVRRKDEPREGYHKLAQTGSLKQARKVQRNMQADGYATRIWHRHPSKQTQPSRSRKYGGMHLQQTPIWTKDHKPNKWSDFDRERWDREYKRGREDYHENQWRPGYKPATRNDKIARHGYESGWNGVRAEHERFARENPNMHVTTPHEPGRRYDR